MNIKTILPALAMAATASFAQQNLSSGIDKANMDLSAKPGTDFFSYAAGGWNAAHPLTAEFSRYSQFNALQENNNKQIRELIENFANSEQKPGSLGQKIGSLYKLGTQASHGCVRLSVDDATWIYTNCPAGTTVKVV